MSFASTDPASNAARIRKSVILSPQRAQRGTTTVDELVLCDSQELGLVVVDEVTSPQDSIPMRDS